jgi:hypothetical protein
MVEIEEAVKSSDGSKCFAFIKEFWDIIKDDVRILFDQFFGNDCLPKC